ncbi:MAG: Rrf2 family transcriptional regulator [Ilumatobacteraceae bacterium]
MAQLAAASPDGSRCITAEEIATAQEIPAKFLLEILQRASGRSSRSQPAGNRWGLCPRARPAADITLAEILRALEGPLMTVHDSSLSELSYPGPAEALVEVWMATRSALRSVFDQVTLAQLVTGKLPAHVRKLAAEYVASAPT